MVLEHLGSRDGCSRGALWIMLGLDAESLLGLIPAFQRQMEIGGCSGSPEAATGASSWEYRRLPKERSMR